MKSIYMVATEDKKDLFDFYLRDKMKEEYEHFFKKTLVNEGGTDVGMINHKIEYLKSFDYIIVDRDSFANNDATCVQMIKQTVSFLDEKTRAIFVWLNMSEDIKKDLISSGINNLNIVSGLTLDEQKEEILECFSPMGMQRYNTNYKTSKNDNFEKYNFREDKVFNIEVFSTDNMLRDKAFTMSICKYINEVDGVVVLLCPYATDNEIAGIARMMGAEKQDTFYKVDNIYITQVLDFINVEYNFLVIDLGYISEKFFNENREDIIDPNVQKNVIICDINEIEEDYITQILSEMGQNTILVNSKNEAINISNITGVNKDFFESINKNNRIKMYEKQELIDIRANRNLFHSIIFPHIVSNKVAK